MTTDERLAKVAEVLARATDCMECEGTGCSLQGWSANYGDQFGPCQVCTRVAQALAPLLDEFAAQDYAAGAASVIAYPEAALRERVAAACRLAEPDHLTPMGARIILAAVRAGRHDARATAPLAASQPERGSEGHRDATSGQGGEA